MQRATEAVVRMATLARQLGATRIEAVATSAVRDASNARQFADMVRRAAKLQLRVLEGSDEALLGFRSALAHFDLAVGSRRRRRHRRRLARARAQRRGARRPPRLPPLRRAPHDGALLPEEDHAQRGEGAPTRSAPRAAATSPRARVAQRAGDRLRRNVHESRGHVARASGNSPRAERARHARASRRPRAHSRLACRT